MTKQELINFELFLKEAWENGDIRVPLHLSGGNEDQLIEIFKEVNEDDYVFSTHRNHYHYLLHGGDASALVSEIFGERNGLCHGNAGSMCTIDKSRRFFASAIVSGVTGIAVGVAWALKASGSDRKVWCFLGDGAIDEGHSYEAIRYAVGWDLPIIFVVEDNDRATCTDQATRWGDCDSAMVTDMCDKVYYYKYTPTYPHVGSGKYVQF